MFVSVVNETLPNGFEKPITHFALTEKGQQEKKAFRLF